MTQAMKDMMTVAIMIEESIVNSVFDNVARKIVAMDFAKKTGELYGGGQPRFNAAVKAAIAEELVVHGTRGNETVYRIA